MYGASSLSGTVALLLSAWTQYHSSHKMQHIDINITQEHAVCEVECKCSDRFPDLLYLWLAVFSILCAFVLGRFSVRGPATAVVKGSRQLGKGSWGATGK